MSEAARFRVIAISFAAMGPTWCVQVGMRRLLLRMDHTSWAYLTPTLPEIVDLALSIALGGCVVLAMSRARLFRSDLWWLAGGLFVVAAVIATLITDVPADGDGFVLDLALSAVDGYWLTVFAAGALAWRHWTPTYVPASWMGQRVAGDDR